jgi:glycosyltransferase involved in cell wall biosynthesis
VAAKKIKVGFLTERMLLGFGVDLVIDEIATGLCGLGYEVTVYPSLTDGTYDSAPYEVKPIPTPAIAIFPLYDRNARQWVDMLNNEDVDIWLVSTFPFFSLMPHLKAPSVAIDYGICSTEGFSFENKLNFAYMKWSQQKRYFPKAAKIVTISGYVKSLLPKTLQSKTDVIYIGADHYIRDWRRRGEPMAEAAEFRAERAIADSDVLLTYIGRLNPEGQPYKGTKDLMDIFSELSAMPSVKTMMVGYGDDADAERIRNLGIIPFVKAPVETMPVIHAATDIYVTASKWEGFDLPLVEAAFFGKPGVALNIGAHPEVVENGQGALLADSPAGIKENLLKLIGDKEARARMGASAAGFAKRFEWERAVSEYDAMIKEVLA